MSAPSPLPWGSRETIDGMEIIDAAGELVCEIRRAPRAEVTGRDRRNFTLIRLSVHAAFCQTSIETLFDPSIAMDEFCDVCGGKGGDNAEPSQPCPACGKERGS